MSSFFFYEHCVFHIGKIKQPESQVYTRNENQKGFLNSFQCIFSKAICLLWKAVNLLLLDERGHSLEECSYLSSIEYQLLAFYFTALVAWFQIFFLYLDPLPCCTCCQQRSLLVAKLTFLALFLAGYPNQYFVDGSIMQLELIQFNILQLYLLQYILLLFFLDYWIIIESIAPSLYCLKPTSSKGKISSGEEIRYYLTLYHILNSVSWVMCTS